MSVQSENVVNWMDGSDILYRHSWSPEDDETESCWLEIALLSSSATMRIESLNFCD